MGERFEMPERYSADSDDTLMNMLIKDGYAFSREKGSEMKITLNCGCNCNCCFGQKESDFWELSKSCGCDCGCCANNKFHTKSAPQYWINRQGAYDAGKGIVQRNKKISGAKLDEYMNENFGPIWADYDVLKVDMVEIEQMSSFYKKLLKDSSANIQ